MAGHAVGVPSEVNEYPRAGAPRPCESSSVMRLPDFLIIGAMKAGTTSLYRDLLTNPRIYFPADKEPESLSRPDIESEAGLRAYGALFAGAAADQICGEASTGYTRLPETPGVAERARRVLGPGARIIYLVREPVARTISHHHHDFSYGRVDADVNRVIRERPTYLDTSRYAMQVSPWLEAFGRDRVRIIRFEDYIADRPGVTAAISEFIGVEPRPDLVEAGRVFNRAADRRRLAGPFAAVQRSSVYRRMVRPLLPIRLKDRLRDSLLPADTAKPVAMTAESVEYVLDALRPDVERLQAIMEQDEPIWNEESIRRSDTAAPAAGPDGVV